MRIRKDQRTGRVTRPRSVCRIGLHDLLSPARHHDYRAVCLESDPPIHVPQRHHRKPPEFPRADHKDIEAPRGAYENVDRIPLDDGHLRPDITLESREGALNGAAHRDAVGRRVSNSTHNTKCRVAAAGDRVSATQCVSALLAIRVRHTDHGASGG